MLLNPIAPACVALIFPARLAILRHAAGAAALH
jgi:hypothetical protein